MRFYSKQREGFRSLPKVQRQIVPARFSLQWILRRFNPIQSFLASLFPMEPLGTFHPIDDMKTILGYQYRISRTKGVEATDGISQTRLAFHITPTSVKCSIEGEYMELGNTKVGDLQFPERSRKVAVYPSRETHHEC
jgi:hypothetical protein